MADSFKTVTTEQLTTGTVLQYTAPTSTKANVVKGVVNNTSTSTVTFTLTMTVAGDSAATYSSAKPVGPKKSYNFTGDFTGSMDAGDAINMFASTASVMNMKMRILEST